MLGSIFTSENCPVCGLRMKDNHKDAVSCPKHPRQKAHCITLKFGRKIKLRFTDYTTASRELTAMRRDVDLNRFDERDFKRETPLGFSAVAEKYLKFKQKEAELDKIGKRSFVQIRRNINKASDFFGNVNIRELSTALVRDFELSLSDYAPKTIADMIGAVRAMHNYMVDGEEFVPIRRIKWPEADLENMAMRKTIGKDTQDAVIEEVKAITKDNPRIWLGIRWLSIYTSIRPFELLGILERDVDLEQGLVCIRTHKNSRKKGPKYVPLLHADIENLRTLPKGFPHMHLFRRDAAGGGRKAGSAFGQGIFYDYWKLACSNLGISGVDLYGGTRHSTQRFYRRHMSTEDCMRLSQHTTSKSGQRYINLDHEEMLAGYALADRTTGPHPDHQKSRVTDLKPRLEAKK